MIGYKQGVAANLLVLFVFALAVQADDRKLIEKKPADKDPTTDQEFVTKALACDIAEVKVAERAIKQSTNKDVTAFARKMRDEHTECRDALMKRAREMKLAVLEGLDKDTQDRIDRLSKLEGSNYDFTYMRFMVDSHEKALRLYEAWAEKAKDRDLADHIKRAIPKIKEHVEQARDISKKLLKSQP